MSIVKINTTSDRCLTGTFQEHRKFNRDATRRDKT